MLKRFAATTAIAVTLGTTLVTAAPSQAQPTCASVHIISVAGTAESSPTDDPNSITGFAAGRNFVKELDEKYEHVTSWQLPYTASAGALASLGNTKAPQPLPYGASRAEGSARATEHIAQVAAECPDTKFVLTGFSQGASVAGDVTADILGGKIAGVDKDSLLATYLIADPGRAQLTGEQGTSSTGATGLRGKNGELVIPLDKVASLTGTEGLTSPRAGSFAAAEGDVLSFCHPNDIACATEPNGILQKVGTAANNWTSNYPHHLAAGTGLQGVDLLALYQSAVGLMDLLWLPNAILTGDADRVAPVLERAANSSSLTPSQREAVRAANQEVLMALRAIREYQGTVPEYQGDVLATVDIPPVVSTLLSGSDSKKVLNLLPYVANMMPHHLSYFTGAEHGPWTIDGKAVDEWIYADLDVRLAAATPKVTETPDTGTPDTETPDTGTPGTETPDTGTPVTEPGSETVTEPSATEPSATETPVMEPGTSETPMSTPEVQTPVTEVSAENTRPVLAQTGAKVLGVVALAVTCVLAGVGLLRRTKFSRL